MIAIISLVKYQGTLDSKISSLFPACYQYYDTESLQWLSAVCYKLCNIGCSALD